MPVYFALQKKLLLQAGILELDTLFSLLILLVYIYMSDTTGTFVINVLYLVSLSLAEVIQKSQEGKGQNVGQLA